jgi:hypothetical protein
MDSFDNFGQRYDSFNLPRNLLKHHEKDKEKISHAYSYAINQAKLKNQHILYKTLINEANSKGIKLSALADYDPEWIQKREQEFRQEYSKKEAELKLHIANNIKPSIQMSYLELARLLLKAGDSKDFEQYAAKAHEVQPTNSEANYYYKISLLLNNKTDELKKITDHEVEQENYRSMASDQRTAYLHGRVISAIVKLKTKDFYGAFNTLCSISTEFLPDIGIYTSFYDLARYLAVLGIICCKREEIASKVFGESTKQLMNHNHNAVKLVESFVNANYDEGSKALDQLMSDWSLDSYVENVMSPVQGYILDKFIKQYLSTISRVKIDTIAETFRITPQQCEDILQNLILTNKIPFRIDTLQRTLVYQDEEIHSQSRLVKKAIGIAGNYCFEKQFAVLKVSFNAVSGNRQKGKGMMDAFME